MYLIHMYIYIHNLNQHRVFRPKGPCFSPIIVPGSRGTFFEPLFKILSSSSVGKLY